MAQIQKRNKSKSIRRDDPVPDLPKIVLLKKKQWQLLQKRYRMTNRELDIAQLICRGLNNEEIADILDIRYGTVKTHIRNIYRKTWVRNKIAMLLRFIEEASRFAPKTAKRPAS